MVINKLLNQNELKIVDKGSAVAEEPDKANISF